MWYATPDCKETLWDNFQKSPLLSLRAVSLQKHTATCCQPPPSPWSVFSLQRCSSVLSRLSEVRHVCPNSVPAVFPLRPAPAEIQGDTSTFASSSQTKQSSAPACVDKVPCFWHLDATMSSAHSTYPDTLWKRYGLMSTHNNDFNDSIKYAYFPALLEWDEKISTSTTLCVQLRAGISLASTGNEQSCVQNKEETPKTTFLEKCKNNISGEVVLQELCAGHISWQEQQHSSIARVRV